ncbi:MAG: DUF4864 domain-containing protein [Drouetiella hepatica Uher 2000/2452]|uniref:DUF4864 domain-containing protein n=1 Tax=Drouetiella hepatica Uher 2000/2452 TaxID=904376 RepID=A0A951UMJ0_9CYAN|nr:DUF4864 domain-containing protein [Drouetiella hepatica Uher 2000/2452]
MSLTSSDRNTIRFLIESQLQAFQHNDAEASFSLASPSIQEQFGTPEVFLAMVKTAYPSVYRPRSVVFEDMTMVQGLPAQKVMLMSAEGELVRAVYLMQQQRDQTWRIHGCFLIPVGGKTMG